MKKRIAKAMFSLAKTSVGDEVVGLVFGKFSKFLPVKKIKETDRVIAFWHPKPFWEKHILIVPKRKIKSIASVSGDDLEFVGEVLLVAKEIILELDWDKEGYTLLANGGTRQEVNQLHFHLACGERV
jgi:histidine triad (HIT) family protein